MASGHEAQSVIGEEFHEFTLAVWFGVDQKGRPADPRAEAIQIAAMAIRYVLDVADRAQKRSEEHTSELQSLMRISYAVFCLKKKHQTNNTVTNTPKHTQ